MLADKHTRNAHLLSDPSNHAARGVPAQDALARTPLWSTMMKVSPGENGPWDPKQANGNNSGKLALSPQALIFPPPLLGHQPMVTSLLDWSKVIIRPMKDGDGESKFELGSKPTKSRLTRLTRSMSALQANPVATHSWPEWHPMVGGVFCEPSQHDEPPIPGPSPSSLPPEDIATREPEPEVAPTQSMEEPFACAATPRSIIIIADTPVGSPTPPPSTPTPDLPPIAFENPTISSPLVPSSSHSYNDAFQEFTNL
ncbi:hypothetical protein O181_079233 [Austropuccinia psidii MF-1]|uniref:Uncharacterized protein n=1 Tax=Austropuccinia psidii MF-1 TaxID=1389203 RepID=A0A9Q3FKI5_9BASI|nr:hypothetical protein [Austropuccinia psidii MF-1]